VSVAILMKEVTAAMAVARKEQKLGRTSRSKSASTPTSIASD
jgi:hypothetical protein